MSETLMDKAVHNYNVAIMIYNSMEGDESYLNYVGYHLQQSLELAMKAVGEYLKSVQDMMESEGQVEK